MKLWEIKAQSLRLMFADTDIDFSEQEFEEGIVYDNANTREKLIRMNDSIRRAIDLYYQYKGEPTKVASGVSFVEGTNYIEIEDENFGFPVRVDMFIYEEDYEGVLRLRRQEDQIDFEYFELDNQIHFLKQDFTIYDSYTITFRVWYRIDKLNLPESVNELEYDLNTLGTIPEDVQRMIPYYVKGELYEEDEVNIANQSRNLYIQYLMGLRKKFTKAQTKVKSANVFR
jgi:hypothetical protein